MFASSFQHYLSYGSTDQQTVRELSNFFDGLLVPGTVAAFQAEGTRGFVLSLSARSSDPYVIDPRFPLFQNRLERPKKSHLMLADLLGVPGLIHTNGEPSPAFFTPDVIDTIAGRWLDFNIGFEDVEMKTFNKYAARLQEDVLPENKQKPAFILPPYTMGRRGAAGWERVGADLWDSSVRQAVSRGASTKLRRVIAADNAADWLALARESDSTELVAWISDLDEFREDSRSELTRYGRALQECQTAGKKVFALYGGFFAVLMARFGLSGASHGIGFGEHRDWVELPASGAPPARYYVPRLHRYLPVDIAEEIWRQQPQLIECDCDECSGRAPASLDYHALMKHSVRVRAREIAEWAGAPTAEVVARLQYDFDAFKSGVDRLIAPVRVIRRAQDSYVHLGMWRQVLLDLSD